MFKNSDRRSIGVIGAMAEEINALKASLTDSRSVTISGREFIFGQLFGMNVVAAMSGIGKVNAAVCTEAMILSFHPDMIVNAGVGGSLDRELGIGAAAIADSVVQHDMDLVPLGYEAGFIDGLDKVYIPCDKSGQALLEKAAEKAGIKHKRGVIASGDSFINDSASKKAIADSFGAIVCEMEGASVGHVCALNDVPFCILRTVSDSGDENSNDDFAASLETSAKAAHDILTGFLKLYSEC